MNRRVIRECLSFAKAKLARHKERYKHFSFIIQFNRIIAVGFNRSTIKPLYKAIRAGYPTHSKIHAEYDAIEHLRLMDNDAWELVNIRLNNMGQLRMAAPCECCHRLLIILGCSVVYYTTNQGTIERMKI